VGLHGHCRCKAAGQQPLRLAIRLRMQQLLSEMQPHVGPRYGTSRDTANGRTTKINQAGRKATFHDVLHAPENLLSGQVHLSKKVYPIVHDGNPRPAHDGKTVPTITFANNK